MRGQVFECCLVCVSCVCLCLWGVGKLTDAVSDSAASFDSLGTAGSKSGLTCAAPKSVPSRNEEISPTQRFALGADPYRAQVSQVVQLTRQLGLLVALMS